MSRRLSRLLILFAFVLLGNLPVAQAITTTLFLLNGTVVRGEIVARSPRVIQVQTASGLVKVKTVALMPISRQQLKLPSEIENVEVDAVLAQMEKLVAENEALKLEIANLKAQVAKVNPPTATDPAAPGEGPKK